MRRPRRRCTRWRGSRRTCCRASRASAGSGLPSAAEPGHGRGAATHLFAFAYENGSVARLWNVELRAGAELDHADPLPPSDRVVQPEVPYDPPGDGPRDLLDEKARRAAPGTGDADDVHLVLGPRARVPRVEEPAGTKPLKDDS